MRSKCFFAIMAVGILGGPAVLNGQTIPNGDFSNGLASWTSRGNVTVQPDSSGNYAAVFAEANSGGLSSLTQTFTLPANSTWLSFRYRLFSGTPSAGAVPPDSFTAYVSTSAGQRLIAPAAEPTFTKAILYEDERGELLHPTQVIREPSGQGQLFRIKIPLAGVPSQAVTVRFVFGNAANATVTYAMLDDVVLGCPPGYCCNLTSGNFLKIDDGLICTTDQCQSNGTVTHTPIQCCGECGGSEDPRPVTIVVMIDETFSTNANDFQLSKNALKTLLDFFTAAPLQPAISVGRFDNDLPNGAVIDVALTTNYTPLYNWYNNYQFRTARGRTPLSKAIEASTTELQQHSPANARKYMILITDGWTNKPDDNHCPGTPGQCCSPDGTGPNCYCICRCTPARNAAVTAANTAKGNPNNIQIYVSHYIGQAENTCSTALQSNDVQNAMNWLRNSIASTPGHFMPNTGPNGAGPLECTFFQLAELINCDDGVACTVDHCELGVCVHDPCP